MALTKKDFEAIAETISKIEDPITRKKEVQKWIRLSEESNKLFKKGLFKEACKPEHLRDKDNG